jgi:hypothetical protein
MLAEELSDKNEEIAQLRHSLRAYEETYKVGDKFLEDDLITLRSELNRLEHVK